MEIQTALFLGLGIFVASWFVHLLIWHNRRPLTYPIWLPMIFLFFPGMTILVVCWMGVPATFHYDAATVLAAFMLHTAISCCYIVGYAGIVEYSPSAEILRAVREKGLEGVTLESLNPTSLTEEALTGKRIRHLLASKMATSQQGLMSLTPRGRAVVLLCLTYRIIFGLKGEPKG